MALTKRQLDVIDEWFENGGNETAVLRKYNITHKKWKKWIADKAFNAAVAEKVESVQRQSQILIAQYVPMAAAKLIQLCGSDKGETSRKACLDILAMRTDDNKQSIDADEEEKTMLDDETAAKILAVLAEK
jgi:hypothetical protein